MVRKELVPFAGYPAACSGEGFIELEEFLGKLIGKKVDLVTKKALKPAIKNEILQEVIYV